MVRNAKQGHNKEPIFCFEEMVSKGGCTYPATTDSVCFLQYYKYFLEM